MAKLTEAYLKKMIRQVLSENEDDYDSFSVNQEEMESSSQVDQLAYDIYKYLNDMMEDAEYDDQTSVNVPIANMKGVLKDLGEVVVYLTKHSAGEDYKGYTMSRTARRTGTPHTYSAGPHVSPTMDENRRRTTTPKRK